MGPVSVSEERGVDIGPHPHIGLQTVTWLVAGEILHRDSLGTEQLIRPGQLNLMTAGHGVAHSEEATSYRGDLQGVQLWVAQPEATRHGRAAFEHHASLPSVELDAGLATVLVGTLGDIASPARRDTDHVGVDLTLTGGTTTAPADPAFEYAFVVLEGTLTVDSQPVGPGHLAYLGFGRDELSFTATGRSRALLIGGVPFPETIVMWWNFVGRTRDEIASAYEDWQSTSGRFGAVDSDLPAMTAPRPTWLGQ